MKLCQSVVVKDFEVTGESIFHAIELFLVLERAQIIQYHRLCHYNLWNSVICLLLIHVHCGSTEALAGFILASLC